MLGHLLQPCGNAVTQLLELSDRVVTHFYSSVTKLLEPCEIAETSLLQSCDSAVTQLLQPVRVL